MHPDIQNGHNFIDLFPISKEPETVRFIMFMFDNTHKTCVYYLQYIYKRCLLRILYEYIRFQIDCV